jgi:hypothetical protein
MILFWKFILIIILLVLVYYRKDFKYTLSFYVVSLFLGYAFLGYNFINIFDVNYELYDTTSIWYIPYLLGLWIVNLYIFSIDVRNLLNRKNEIRKIK